jgi:hypothetical protein
MADIEFRYKGKKVVIRETHPDATLSVDGRRFSLHHHHPPEGPGLAMWMCSEATFGSPDIKEVARHVVDYLYLFEDPGRVRVDDAGKVIERDTPGGGGHGDHGGHGGGH